MFDLGYNISDDATCRFTACSSPDNTNPQLGSLGFNSGPTETIPLLPRSSAIDAIPLGHCRPQTTDQRDLPRPDGRENVTLFCSGPRTCWPL